MKLKYRFHDLFFGIFKMNETVEIREKSIYIFTSLGLEKARSFVSGNVLYSFVYC